MFTFVSDIVANLGKTNWSLGSNTPGKFVWNNDLPVACLFPGRKEMVGWVGGGTSQFQSFKEASKRTSAVMQLGGL